jgi:predicted component of type VI protein secretion system
MGSPFRIILRSGPTPGKIFPLEKNELYIGRDLSNDIVINDPEISRRHTRLFQQSGTYAVEDMGSTNGTSINGQRLTGPGFLQPGDVLTLGERVTLHFEALPVAENVAVPMDAQAAAYPPTYEMPRPRASYSPTPAAPRAALDQPQPDYPPQSYQPSADYVPPAYQPAQQAFAGQVPQAPGADLPTPTAQPHLWPFYLVIGVLLVVVLLLVIDDFRLWCPLFGLCG